MLELFYGNTIHKADNFVNLPPNHVIDAYYNETSVLRGKKIYFVGDSLTEVNFRTDNGYVKRLGEQKGILSVNHGESGYGYSTKDEESFIGKESDESDAFVIFLGVNDFLNISQFSLSLDPVLKSAKRLIARACVVADNRPIGVITPMHYAGTLNNARGAGGYTLQELTDGIKHVVREVELIYSRTIPILDLTQINPLNVTQSNVDDSEYIEKYFSNESDALHPNDLGWKIITPYISNWIETTFNFPNNKPTRKTGQVTRLVNGDIEINTITTPTKYGSDEENSYNRNKFVIPLFADGSFIYSIKGEYTEERTKYEIIATVNDYFTFSTDYHPLATDYQQWLYYFDVDKITTNPTEYLETHTVKTVKEERNVDDKEANYILNLVRLYKEYLDTLLFTDEEKKTLGLFKTSSMPMKLKLTIRKR